MTGAVAPWTRTAAWLSLRTSLAMLAPRAKAAPDCSGGDSGLGCVRAGVGARATETPEPALAALPSAMLLECELATVTGPGPPATDAAPICVLPSVVSTWPASAVESPLPASTARTEVGAGSGDVVEVATAGAAT